MTKKQAQKEVRKLIEAGYTGVNRVIGGYEDGGPWHVYATDPTTGKRFAQLV